MEDQKENWRLDEVETLRALVQMYRKNIEGVVLADRGRFATREELVYCVKELIGLLDRSVTQTERLMDCTFSLAKGLESLTLEVERLKALNEGEEREPFEE